MEVQEYDRLREHEASYWWHVGKRALLTGLLRSGVSPDPHRPGLDVGCGAGGNFPVLAPYGRFVGSDMSAEAFGKERLPRPVLLAEGTRLPFGDGSLGMVTFFDVLEHIEEEDAFLSEVSRVLRPGGLAFLSVPAYMFLWSEHDVALHHQRRYVRGTLAAALRRNRFEVQRMTYGFCGVFPGVAAVRLLGRVLPRRQKPRASYVPTPRPLAALLVAALRLEGWWLRRGDLPFGTSLFALARKGGA